MLKCNSNNLKNKFILCKIDFFVNSEKNYTIRINICNVWFSKLMYIPTAFVLLIGSVEYTADSFFF